MTENRQGRNCVQNVGCSVKDCKYHGMSNVCMAEHISVQSENAQRKAETFCNTFVPRSSM